MKTNSPIPTHYVLMNDVADILGVIAVPSGEFDLARKVEEVISEHEVSKKVVVLWGGHLHSFSARVEQDEMEYEKEYSLTETTLY